MPWPVASLASSGISALSSALAFSCSAWAARVRRKMPANSAHELDAAHIDQPDRRDPWSWRLGIEEARGLAGHHRAPEVPLGGDEEVLVERVGRDLHVQPMAAAGDDRERRLCSSDDPHVVLELGHVLRDRPFLREGPGQHELGLEHRPGALDDAVEGGRHPAYQRVDRVPLHVLDGLAGVQLVPAPIEVLGRDAELDDEVAGQVLRLDLAALLLPEADKRGFILPP